MSSQSHKVQSILRNPFFHRGPVRDRQYFCGRTAETRQALQMLRNGQCVSIVGPRRIGKTSLQFHLCNPEVQKEHDLGEEYLFVYIDCQGMGDLDKVQFYQWLWQETKRTLAEREKVDDWARDITSFNEFREAMMIVREKGYKPALLLDEFEGIAQNCNLDPDLFSDLRSLVPNPVYVTASHDPLYNLTYADRSVLSSPFFNIFFPLWLGLMEPEEARNLVEKTSTTIGLQYFDEDDLTFMRQLAGTFPFYLQIACYHLFEEKNERSSLCTPIHDRVRQQFLIEVKSHFDYTWNHLSDGEKGSLRLISNGRSDEVSSEEKMQLSQKCLVYHDSIFSSAFADFVNSHYLEDDISRELLGYLDLIKPIAPSDLAATALLTLDELEGVLSHLVDKGLIEKLADGSILLSRQGQQEIASDRRRSTT
jgi:hypothetical protein